MATTEALPVQSVRQEIERWRNHFADLDAMAEQMADELRLGAGDLYGAMVAGGIVFAFLFQVFVNIGMTMGIAPVTGIPLPFVTVGGSSMVANLVAIGVLEAIHARGRPDAFQ